MTGRATANGGPVGRARHRWRIGVLAVAVGLVAVWAVRAGLALAGGDVASALGHVVSACVFAAGCLAGRLIEGLRHAPEAETERKERIC